MKMSLVACAAGAALAVVAPTYAVGKPVKEPKPENHYYRTTTLTLPTSNEQARELGRDQTGDKKPDNKLGQVLVALATQGFDFAGAAQHGIDSGQVVMVDILRTPSLVKAKHASWKVRYGKTAVADRAVTLDDSAPKGKALKGKIKKRHDGRFGPGSLALRVALVGGGQPMTIKVANARVDASCTRKRCTDGRITGAVTSQEVDSRLIPALAAVFQGIVESGCTGETPDTCTPDAQMALNLFDADHDLVITAQELRDNDLVKVLIAPDLDLAKANGKPGQDGKADALSFGVGFSATKVKVTR